MKKKDIRHTIPVHKTRKPKKRNSATHIVVHTTASNQQDPNETARYHVTPGSQNHLSKKGAPTLGYHDFIAKDGTVYHCVDYTSITWHAGLYNTRSVGVAMAFKGQTGVQPELEQYKALVKHLVTLCLYLKIKPQNVIGHREVPGMWKVLGNGSKKYKKNCLLPHNKVLLSDSCVPISKVQIGDLVFGPLSHDLQNVTDVIINEYKGEIVSIQPMYDCFLPLTCTPDHKLLAWPGIKCDSYSRQRKICNPFQCGNKQYHRKNFVCSGQNYSESNILSEINWIEAKNLHTGSYLALDLGQYKTTMNFSNELAWLAGLYCAEGHEYQNQSVWLSFNKHTELELVKKAKSIAENLGYQCLIKDCRTALGLVINGRFHDVVSRFVKGNRATNKYLSTELMNQNTSFQSHFLSGYLKGDGCEDLYRIRFSTSSETLANQLFILLARIGFNPSKMLGRGERDCAIEGRAVHAQQEFAVEARKSCETNFAIRAGNYFLFPIRNISYSTYNGPVYDITVDNDECFYVNNITVHNCPGFGVDLDALRHEITGRLQRRLSAEGLYTGKVDYMFGPKSTLALQSFNPLGSRLRKVNWKGYDNK